VRGRKIDIWVPSSSTAMRFGHNAVKFTVQSDASERPASTHPQTPPDETHGGS
jgi:hypothetical protein